MNTAVMAEVEVEADGDVDAIDEMRLRTWARKHYRPVAERDIDLHPVVLDEMVRKDSELQ